ncbi:MAG: O-antigen ligase family protein [Gemmatimonadaceae bacterium]
MRLTPRVLLAVSAVTLVLGNVGRIPGGALGGRNAPIGLNDLLLAPLWLVVIGVVLRGQRRWTLDTTTGWSALFVALASLSTMMAVSHFSMDAGEAFGVSAFLIRWVLYFGWYPLVAACLDVDDVHAVWRHFDSAILCFAIFGLFQVVFLPGFAQMISDGGVGAPQWDVQGRRLVSTLLDPNFAGILLAIALLMRIARVAEGLNERKLPLIVLSAALLLTVSRSSLLALAVGILAIVAARGLKMRLVKVFLGGALLGLPFITLFLAFASGFNKLRVDASALQRLVPWLRALELIRDNPALGVGFNAVPFAQLERGWRTFGGSDVSMDGGLLFVGAMTGVIGLLLYVGLLVSAVRRARRVWRNAQAPAQDRAFATGAAAVTVAVVVHSFFVNSLLLPFVMQLLWILWGSVRVLQRATHTSSIKARSIVRPVIGLAIAATTACTPCSGSLDCTTSPRLDATGTIVRAVDGKGAANVRITATLPNGTAKSTTTNSEGRWRIVIDDAPGDLSNATITVASAGSNGYVVHDAGLTTRTGAGDSQDVGRWMSKATARYQAALIYRGLPLAGATVTFTPAAGILATNVKSPGISNGGGIFELDIESPNDLGTLVGSLHVAHPDIRASDLNGFTIPLEYKYGLPGPKGSVTIGGVISYGAQVLFRGTHEQLSGVPVEFQRTAGISTIESIVRVTTGGNGFFRLDLTPNVSDNIPLFGFGVVGDVVIKPVGLPETRYTNVHLNVYDSLSLRSLGSFAYGESWAWALEIWRNSTLAPTPGVDVEFRQTSGLAIAPTVIKGRTDAGGRVELRSPVHDTGTVIGDLVVMPAGEPQKTIRNIKLRTSPDDNLHFAGVFGFGPALRYQIEVLQVNGTPVVGAQVLWTQSSGIAATPSSSISTTDASGRASVTLLPSTDGEVVGTIRVTPPAPWTAGTSFTFTNLHLATFESGSTVLGTSYRISAP